MHFHENKTLKTTMTTVIPEGSHEAAAPSLPWSPLVVMHRKFKTEYIQVLDSLGHIISLIMVSMLNLLGRNLGCLGVC